MCVSVCVCEWGGGEVGVIGGNRVSLSPTLCLKNVLIDHFGSFYLVKRVELYIT